MSDTIPFSEVLDALRNESHDDLDDKYAGPCPECGGKQVYDRSVPRDGRPLVCQGKCNAE
jgi:ssDNA-binding Zn-finger/Zn-ribbon topoisomerase 1